MKPHLYFFATVICLLTNVSLDIWPRLTFTTALIASFTYAQLLGNAIFHS